MDAERAVTDPCPSSNNHEKQLSWLWVIESLSTAKLVDSSFLNVLISKASQLTEDELFGEMAKEKLAVDQLEDLIGGVGTCNLENARFSSKSAKLRLDESERAQDVLTRLLGISDVQKFVLYKRAVLSKSSLQQLNSKIAFTCSREIRGLARENHPNKKILVDPEVLDGANSSEKLFSQRGGSSEKEEQQDRRTNCFGGGVNIGAANRDASVNYLEIQSPDENSRHLLSEDGNTLFPEDSCGKGLIYTRERSPEVKKIRGLGGRELGFDIVGNAADRSLEQSLKDGGVRLKHQTSAPIVPENMNETLQDSPPDSTLVSNEKESSCLPEIMQEHYLDKGDSCGDISQLKPLRLNSTPLHVNGSVQDPSERVLVSREKEDSELAKRTLVGGVNFVDDGHGCECIPSKTLKRSREDGEIQHTEEVIAEEALDAYHLKSSSDTEEVISKVGASTYTAVSSKNDEKRACSFDSEMVIAAKKQKCLNYNYPSSLGAQVIGEWTEGNVCRKCNRSGGNLLICSVVSCRVVVHESCAGSSVGVTDSGKYHCPICSCVEAITVYRETKKKAFLVEKKVLFHKNQLSKFMSMLNEQEQQSSEVNPDKELIKNQRDIENQATVEPCTSEHSDDLHRKGLEERTQYCENASTLEERAREKTRKL
ncbi:uncharacterized protein LOC113297459 isoform X2 [Papaver somniferum]|uniref:uncharacterized protein LOC113297459 isoform X2 n=1 Tax=Papaver somniferum TaxID=3469 RepID=UPI000E6FE0BE|nr:uncharacterized protein LOC113297459 isoform X2 [Papaver somniferum]